jgi:hypothetical protein
MRTMQYTDNTKGFRRRNVMSKIEHLLQDILYNIEYIQDILSQDNDWMMDEEYNQWMYELEDWENSYSIINGIRCQMNKGIPVHRMDLEFCTRIWKSL